MQIMFIFNAENVLPNEKYGINSMQFFNCAMFHDAMVMQSMSAHCKIHDAN